MKGFLRGNSGKFDRRRNRLAGFASWKTTIGVPNAYKYQYTEFFGLFQANKGDKRGVAFGTQFPNNFCLNVS